MKQHALGVVGYFLTRLRTFEFFATETLQVVHQLVDQDR
jgi:hypothetical protein